MLAAGLLLVLLGVFGWRSVGALADAVRGLAYSRPGPAQVRARPSQTDATLQAALDRLAAGEPGAVGIAVKDLRSGATAAVDDGRTFAAASLFKLPILVEVLKQQQLGRLRDDQLLEVQQRHWADGSGVLQARIGERLAVQELLRLMVAESDNIAALALLDAVGVEETNETMTAMGLRQTRLRDRWRGEQQPHTTSPADVLRLLETIATGALVDGRTSERALELLELKQANAWLADELPWWAKLAHKWGDLPNARHDAGIVYAPRSTYAIVVMTESADPEAARRLIARVSKMAFDRFEG